MQCRRVSGDFSNLADCIFSLSAIVASRFLPVLRHAIYSNARWNKANPLQILSLRRVAHKCLPLAIVGKRGIHGKRATRTVSFSPFSLASFRYIHCYHRIQYLADSVVRDLFVKSLKRTQTLYRMRVNGFVVMPEHVHLLIGDVEPLTSADVVGRSHQALKEYQAGILAEYMPYTPLTAPNLKKLADLKPKTLAIMHGSSFTGDCARAPDDFKCGVTRRLRPADVAAEISDEGSFLTFGKGFLTGKIANTKFDSTDFRSSVPRFSPRNRKTNQALVDLVSSFAARRKVTPAQIALAWLLAKKPWIVPIPGTTKLERLEENLGAATVELGPDDIHALEEASSKIKFEGARYPKFHEQLVGR